MNESERRISCCIDHVERKSAPNSADILRKKACYGVGFIMFSVTYIQCSGVWTNCAVNVSCRHERFVFIIYIHFNVNQVVFFKNMKNVKRPHTIHFCGGSRELAQLWKKQQ